MQRPRFLPDNFTLALLTTVCLASIIPVNADAAVVLDHITGFAVSLLFFLHGARLSREAAIAGAVHWRLHLTVLCSTFVLFPLLGLALKPVLSPLVTPDLYLGILFLCVLPSTVQSSIAFTAMARGNVPAAICSASASNLLGIFITPVLLALVVATQSAAGSTSDAVLRIVLQLLVPFVAGQICRRWIGGWVERRKSMLKLVDQGSILLVVFSAFSEAVAQGLWSNLPLSALAGLALIDALLLALALGISTVASRYLGFDRADEATIVFCGSKKSLASGVPMAKVLFPSQTVGVVVLPLMLFHQIQLIVCAMLARRYALRAEAEQDGQERRNAF